MRKKVSKFLQFFKDTKSATFESVVEKSVLSFLVQITGVFIVFLSNLLIARWFGEVVYGQYSFLFNWIAVFSVISLVGMEANHITILPGLFLQKQLSQIRNILKYSLVTIIALGAVITAVFLVFIYFVPVKGFSNRLEIFVQGLWLIIPSAIAGNLAAYLRGAGIIVKSQIPEKLIRPLAFLLSLFIAYFAYPLARDVSALIICSAISIFLSIGILSVLTNRVLKNSHNISIAPIAKPDFSRNRYFLLISILILLTARLDILSLGYFSALKEVGYYNVALKIADFVGYPLMIINVVVPTLISKYHHLEDNNEIDRMLRYCSGITFLTSTFSALIAIIAGKWLMIMYGANFEQAYPSLIILCVSHLITAFSGPVCAYLIVTGREKFAVLSMAANVIVTGVFCYILIPEYGGPGAAYASLAGNIVFNSLIVFFFFRIRRVFVTPFGILRKN